MDLSILADKEAAALENCRQQVYSASSFSLSHPYHHQYTDSHRKASKDSQSRMNQHKTKTQTFKKLRYQREVSYLYQNLKYWVFVVVVVYRNEPMNLRIHMEMEGAQNTTTIWKRNWKTNTFYSQTYYNSTAFKAADTGIRKNTYK